MKCYIVKFRKKRGNEGKRETVKQWNRVKGNIEIGEECNNERRKMNGGQWKWERVILEKKRRMKEGKSVKIKERGEEEKRGKSERGREKWKSERGKEEWKREGKREIWKVRLKNILK